MKAVLEEKGIDVLEAVHEEYEGADDEEVMRISERLLKKHREAYIALANA